jgi:hypothetical protein
LARHQTKIIGCPECDDNAPVETEPEVTTNTCSDSEEPEGVMPGCPCEHCEDIRNRHRRERNRLNRTQI